MSWIALEAVACDETPDLNPAVRQVMLALAYHHNRVTGECYPSQETLAQRAHVTDRTVRTALAVLAGAKLISIREGQGKAAKGARRPDAYDLHFVDAYRREKARRKAEIDATKPEIHAEKPEIRSGEQGRIQEKEHNTPQTPKGAPKVFSDFAPEIRAAVERCWTVMSSASRRRSGKVDMARAVSAALARGAQPDDLVVALASHCTGQRQLAEDGRWAKGGHRIIEQDRWRDWLPDSPAERARMLALETKLSAEPDSAPTVEETKTSPEAVAFSEVGTIDAPGPRRQRSWMDDWQRNPFAWQRHWGPAPGEEGCRIDPDIQREFGAEPYVAPAVRFAQPPERPTA